MSDSVPVSSFVMQDSSEDVSSLKYLFSVVVKSNRDLFEISVELL